MANQKKKQRRQYVVKFDATRLKPKQQNYFLNILQSTDAQNLILKKNKNGLILIGRLPLYDLLEYELKYNNKLKKGVRLALIIRNLDTNEAHVVDGFESVSLNDVEHLRAFDREIRF